MEAVIGLFLIVLVFEVGGVFGVGEVGFEEGVEAVLFGLVDDGGGGGGADVVPVFHHVQGVGGACLGEVEVEAGGLGGEVAEGEVDGGFDAGVVGGGGFVFVGVDEPGDEGFLVGQPGVTAGFDGGGFADFPDGPGGFVVG